MSDEDEQKVRDKMEQASMEYPVALHPPEANAAYEVRAVPSTFLIDRDGTIVWKGHPVHLDEERLAALVD